MEKGRRKAEGEDKCTVKGWRGEGERGEKEQGSS